MSWNDQENFKYQAEASLLLSSFSILLSFSPLFRFSAPSLLFFPAQIAVHGGVPYTLTSCKPRIKLLPNKCAAGRARFDCALWAALLLKRC
jgi:hypothetical protein